MVLSNDFSRYTMVLSNDFSRSSTLWFFQMTFLGVVHYGSFKYTMVLSNDFSLHYGSLK